MNENDEDDTDISEDSVPTLSFALQHKDKDVIIIPSYKAIVKKPKSVSWFSKNAAATKDDPETVEITDALTTDKDQKQIKLCVGQKCRIKL